MFKKQIVSFSLALLAMIGVHASSSPAKAQLGTRQISNYYGVEVTSNLSRESALATIIRNVANRQSYSQGEYSTSWSSQGWVPYPSR